MNSALFQALKSGGMPGAPALTSQTPAAPAPVPPSAGAGNPLFDALQAPGDELAANEQAPPPSPTPAPDASKGFEDAFRKRMKLG